MSRTAARGRSWIVYLSVTVTMHLVMIGLARTESFSDSVLQHSPVRVGIGVIVSTIVVAVSSRRATTGSSHS